MSKQTGYIQYKPILILQIHYVRSNMNMYMSIWPEKCVFLPCFPANLLISNSVSLFITLLAVLRWILHISSEESLSDPLCSLCNFSAFVSSWRNTLRNMMWQHEFQQDAQLSQRDRAAGCVIILAKSGRLELGDNILRTLYVYLQPLWYNRLENLSNSGKKRKIRTNTALRSLKVTEVGTNRKPECDFLLVINSNWHTISYSFGVIAAYCSNFEYFAFSSHTWGEA